MKNQCSCGKAISRRAKKCRVCASKGRIPWNLGKKYNRQTPWLHGENNPKWKGAQVEYRGLHNWIEYHKQWTGICQMCGFIAIKRRELDLANISGNYYRNVNDFMWLCKKCHKRFDRGK